MENYDGNTWGNNGPRMITRVLREICAFPKTLVNKHFDCDPLNLHIFPSKFAYAIHFSKVEMFFNPENCTDVLKAVEKSHFIHVLSSHTHSTKVKKDSKSAFIEIVRKCCPLIYEISNDYFE